MRLALRSDHRATTVAIGRALGAALEPLPRGGFVIVLTGDLGAGKTVFASGIALGLGVPASSPVVSPTFTFARGYRGRVPFFHLDAYLLRTPGDLEASGYEELGGEGRVTVVEWGERIAPALPADRLEVSLTPEPSDVSAASIYALGAPALGAPALGDPALGDPATAPDGPGSRRIEFAAHGPEARRILARARGALEAAAEIRP